MERGVYFDGWYPQQYCLHPSLPPRRRGMIDELTRMGGTTLVWAALGGGSISLAYLEEEAYGPVPARFRQHGYVNDSDFLRLASEARIDVFAVVFEAQGWELPVATRDGEVTALGGHGGELAGSTLGLREFTSDTRPRDWKSFRTYFPQGLVNSAGEPVTDLFEECAARDLLGRPLHADWVELSAIDHSVRYMGRNNPVWREYLKAIIRIQIDAGATGIQLDETETPIGTLRYGGCFCKDCVRVLRDHLLTLPTDELPDAVRGVDLTSFDYRTWLLDSGYEAGVAPQTLPLYDRYVEALTREAARTFRELAQHAREYAASKGRAVRVAGNFFDCTPYYDPMVDEADLFISEMRLTRYRQPFWFRHANGFARGRQVIAVENPYGGVIPELNARLQRGEGYDQFRLTIFEASAMGANMALPYGSWLGNEIRDSSWPPRPLVESCGQFLESIDGLTSITSANEVAVLYSVASMMSATVSWDVFNDGGADVGLRDAGPAPARQYWDAIELLSTSGAMFDVVMAPDEDLRPNDVTAATLAWYRTVLVVSAWAVSRQQHRELVAYAEAGGRVVLFGDYGTQLADLASDLLEHRNAARVGSLDELARAAAGQLEARSGHPVVANLHDLGTGYALHVVNYAYDPDSDRVRPVESLPVSVRLPRPVTRATVHRPGLPPEPLALDLDANRAEFRIPELATYAVVHLA